MENFDPDDPDDPDGHDTHEGMPCCRVWRPGYAGLATNEEDQERESQGIEGLSRS